MQSQSCWCPLRTSPHLDRFLNEMLDSVVWQSISVELAWERSVRLLFEECHDHEGKYTITHFHLQRASENDRIFTWCKILFRTCGLENFSPPQKKTRLCASYSNEGLLDRSLNNLKGESIRTWCVMSFVTHEKIFCLERPNSCLPLW